MWPRDDHTLPVDLGTLGPLDHGTSKPWNFGNFDPWNLLTPPFHYLRLHTSTYLFLHTSSYLLPHLYLLLPPPIYLLLPPPTSSFPSLLLTFSSPSAPPISCKGPLVSLTSNIPASTWPNIKSKDSFEILRTSKFQNWPYFLNLVKIWGSYCPKTK